MTAALAWPAHAWKGSEGLLGLGLAALICMLGAAAGRGVGALMQATGATAEQAPQATQAAVGVRLILTLALSTPVFVLKPVETMPFALWLGAHYLAQMVLEVVVSLRELSQNRGPTGMPAPTQQPQAPLPTGVTTTATERVDDAEGAGER